MYEALIKQGVSENILNKVKDIPKLEGNDIFIGKSIWEKAIISIVAGNNIILSGNKSTGKNVLSRDLAKLFKVNIHEISFHNDVKATDLNSENGILTLCAREGSFGVLDEINMAESDSLAILHSALDFRKMLDIGGGNTIRLHEMTRFIGTMNYGYMGTKELNEALVSRFQVIKMPSVTEELLTEIFKQKFPDLTEEYVNKFAQFFMKIQERARVAEISTKAVDLRGLLDAIKGIKLGLSLYDAMEMGVTGKAFDDAEEHFIKQDLLYVFAKNVKSNIIFK